MSIAILAAPDGARFGAHGLPREVVSQLVERASQAGKTVAVCSCRNASDILDRLRRLDGRSTEFLLLDPGPDAHVGGELDAALNLVGVPYIEVHADRTGSFERVGTPLNVIDGYGAQGYVLALSIALEWLGCTECENDIHVGT
ncbi:type II 3-dehydroquinate dehydratase [Lysobacter sp. S4-A87]|uniref:type II 3-dehydroquinate dehydratase n=1 Tax=Lysobacter sp. S4-A87 TaxID=2925843 RepID=UPI001F53A7F2|nr:type II 3-dehydroquinate dehydratase [Lysobacter sp. S4-A87]UNK49028.1 type II 3-dehydroquinate dehydratase [Lysobacter sp. S4-A87]